MDTEDRIKALREEFQPIQEELKEILFDIRARLMEAQTPIPNDLERQRLGDFLSQEGPEKRGALRIQSDSKKGVEPDGNR